MLYDCLHSKHSSQQLQTAGQQKRQMHMAENKTEISMSSNHQNKKQHHQILKWNSL